MDERQQDGLDGAPPLGEWLKAGNDFFSAWMKIASAMPAAAPEKGTKARSVETWEAAVKMWQSLSSAMSEQETASAVFQGMSTLPEVFLKVAEATWDACFEMQKKTIERAGKIGQRVEAYQFDSVDQEMFKALREIYEQELRHFFYVPKLGLVRSYQERFHEFVDHLNMVHAVGAEFLSLLYLPFEKSFKVVQQQLDDLAREGKLPRETREYYNMFIKVLEGHYMTLFKSPEYNQTLAALLKQLSDYIISKNEVLQDMLQGLPVPTFKEMDELYKELYHLKKRVRSLEHQLQKAS